MVRVEGFEPPCNQLPFQDLIRVRGYTRLCFFLTLMNFRTLSHDLTAREVGQFDKSL